MCERVCTGALYLNLQAPPRLAHPVASELGCVAPPHLYCAFVIEVRCEQHEWRVTRRFSEFLQMDALLRKQLPAAAAASLPSLPPRYVLKSAISPDVVRERVTGLNQWLLQCTTTVQFDTALNAFLGLPLHLQRWSGL